MSNIETRIAALHFAQAVVTALASQGATWDWEYVAGQALLFLETGSFQKDKADPTPAETDSNPTPPVPSRKPRAAKPAASIAVPAPEAAPAPAIEAPVAPVTSPSEKELTLDDVRTALVQCQTRKGSKEVPFAILKKYAPSGTTGTLPKDKYAAVIAECGAA
jgi:hypothetical protein